MIVICRFCGRSAVNSDHAECVESFGDSIKNSIMDWHATHPGEKLPTEITDKLGTEQWKIFEQYMKAKNQSSRIEAQRNFLEKSIRDELQKTADDMIRTLNPEMDVVVSVKCISKPRY